MNTPKNFFRKFLGVFTHRRWWLVEEDYFLYVRSLGGYIFIPKGFVLDFASISKLFWPIMSPTGALLVGSIPHDFGYKYGLLLICSTEESSIFREHEVTRGQLDSILAEVTDITCGVALPGALAKAGLALGGWVAWNKYRKENSDFRVDLPYLNAIKETI